MSETKQIAGQKLRDRMPKGAVLRLSEKFDCSTTWILMVVKGKEVGNPQILKDASKLAKLEDKFRADCKKIYEPIAS